MSNLPESKQSALMERQSKSPEVENEEKEGPNSGVEAESALSSFQLAMEDKDDGEDDADPTCPK